MTDRAATESVTQATVRRAAAGNEVALAEPDRTDPGPVLAELLDLGLSK